MAFKDDFIKGRALRSISAAWLNGIAKALNSLSIRFDPNAKVPRIEKPPMPAGRSGWAIVLPPYPEGGEGGGSSGEVLQLGPQEYSEEWVTETNFAPVIRQYMGKWSYSENSSGEGSWSFERATNADGTERPPAREEVGFFANALINNYASDYSNGIGRVRMPFFNGGRPSDWLIRQVARVVGSMQYAAPADETGNGVLKALNSQISYFAETGQADAGESVLLTTITENANETTTYEDI